MQVFCPLARDSKPAGRQLAHFRRQPPGPPGPLAEQPGMTSVPVLARGFTAQECRRGLGEAAAQGADVRPHFFFSPKSQLAHRRRANGVFMCPAPYPPCALTTGAGGDAAARVYTLARVCMYVGDLANREGWNSWETASRVTGQRLGTSGGLSVCLPLVVCFSIRLSSALSVSISTCL